MLDALYNDQEEQALLLLLLDERYTAMLRATHALVGTVFADQLGLSWSLDDAATRRLLAEAAERVVRINETTREAIWEQLRVGQERGYSPWQIAQGVPAEDYRGIGGLFAETWKHRAETVARTELAHAQVRSALDRYGATGFISRVEIHDGRDYDEPCRERDGTIVPLSEQPGLLHPNCTMAALPVVDDEA